MRRDAWKVVRVQEEVSLDALDRLEDEREDDAEDEDGLRVALPVLLAPRVGAQQPVEAGLDRREAGPRKPGAETRGMYRPSG